MVTVATHHDADGIASLCLFIEAQSAHIEYEFPDEFGGTTEDTDVVLDMTPDPEFGGKVIDHHPQHEDEEDRNYELFFGHKPASILTLEKYRDKIDRNEYWKVMTGAVGDMAPEKVPSYVWREEPSLLDTISYFKGYSGDDKISFRLPKFKKLSSGINSLCKIDMPEKAVNVLHRSDSPDDLIYNKECENARSEVRKEVNKVTKNTNPIDLGNVMYWEFSSKYRINGEISARLKNSTDEEKTAVSYNKETDRGSIRGVLTKLIVEELNSDKYIDAGGHDVAAGFSGADKSNIRDILRDIL